MGKKEKLKSMCAKCPGHICYPFMKTEEPMPSLEDAPEFCPMRRFPEVFKEVRAEYEKPHIREFARLASVQEFECYEHTSDGLRTKFPRLDELIQFSQKCSYKKLGIAFCAGLAREATMLTDVLERKGFDVLSVRCKTGQMQKETIGIREEEKIPGPGRVETMCNPIAQAKILNIEQVDLAIMLGLCVGHDTLFIRYCKVPMTVFAVKDRVLAHNPLAALYLSKSPYYGRMRKRINKVGKGKMVTIHVP